MMAKLRAPAWRRYLLFWGARVAGDIDDELRFHYDMRVRDYVARGMTDDDARRMTLERLGNVEAARDACLTIGERRTRHMAREEWIDAIIQDGRFALRGLARKKGWTLVALLTLALGIGATTAVFSVVDNLILHPIDFPHADRIVLVSQTTSAKSTGLDVRMLIEPKLLAAWRSGAHTIEEVEAYASTDVSIDMRSGPPQEIHAARVTAGLPNFAGRQPIVGRVFNESDATMGQVAMLGEAAWRTRFGGDLGVLGRTIQLNDSLYTIIGVLPGSLEIPGSAGPAPDVWIPISLSNPALGFLGIARLRNGISVDAARRELDGIGAASNSGGPETKYITVLESPSSARGNFRQSLWMSFGAVTLVLLIACANVAHLLLAWRSSRRRELSIRSALGAGVGRLFRQLLTESAILAAAAAVLGVFVAWASLRSLVSVRPRSLSQLAQVHIDPLGLALATAICVVVTLIFGVMGAHRTRGDASLDVLRTMTASASHRDSRLRAGLVATQMALSAMLLVGTGLLVRSVAHLQRIDPGFNASNLYSVTVSRPPARDTTGDQDRAFFFEVASRIRATRGIAQVTLASAPGSEFTIGALQAEGQPEPPTGTHALINTNVVANDYFRAMGIRMVEGTAFVDTTANGNEIIVNEALAKRTWPGQSAIGRRLRIVSGERGAWKRVVGVASNTLATGLTTDATEPVIYAPIAAFRVLFRPTLLVRITPRVENPLPSVRGIIHSLNPHLPAPQIQKVEETMAGTIALPHFTMLLLASFALLSALLAAIGLYGVLAYSVTMRSREIGIRIALGASKTRIAQLVLTQTMGLVLIGGVFGMFAAYRAAQLMSSMLYGVTVNDPWSFALGGAALLVTASVAAVIPTHRALVVDPLTAIRTE